MSDKQPPSLPFPNESHDPPGRRAPANRVDVRDAVAELTERAQAIGQEAGVKVTSAMKDVIGAAAGIAGFAIESARDLVQYMVRRGQMTAEEGERLIREAEAAHEKRSPSDKAKAAANKSAAERAAAAKAEAAARAAAAHAAPYARPVAKTPAIAQPIVSKTPAANAGHKPAAPSPVKSAAPKPAPAKAKAAEPAKPTKSAKPAKPAKATKPAKKRK